MLAIGLAITFAFWPQIKARQLRASLGFLPYRHQWLLWALIGTVVLIGGGALHLMSIPSEILGKREPMIDLRGISPAHVLIFVLGALGTATSEVMLRGVVQPALMRHMAAWPAIALTALLALTVGASLVGLPTRSYFFGVVFALAIHLFFGWIRYRSGSLWPGLAVHTVAGGLLAPMVIGLG